MDIVDAHLDLGANEACKELIRVATERWGEEEGDYRDDVSNFIFLFFMFYHSNQSITHSCFFLNPTSLDNCSHILFAITFSEGSSC